jgi:hypothetical protein
MNTPRHAATQFHFGERVTIIPIDRNNPLVRREPAAAGTIRGWDSSNTHALVELDNGEQNYFTIQALYPEPATATEPVKPSKPSKSK